MLGALIAAQLGVPAVSLSSITRAHPVQSNDAPRGLALHATKIPLNLVSQRANLAAVVARLLNLAKRTRDVSWRGKFAVQSAAFLTMVSRQHL
jgi:hypothetical protein